MAESPDPSTSDAQLSGTAAARGWSPWTAGVWLLRRLAPGQARRAHEPAPSPSDAHTAAAGESFAPASTAPAVAETAVAPEPTVEPPAPPPQMPPNPSGPGYAPAPPPGPADLRVCHAEVRGAVDEIARRVVSAGGLLDACGKAADEALADIEALRDEERHAQKLLSALRGRLLLLDQRCHALAQAAHGQSASDEPAAELQAALAQVRHCHQLAERLGAVERQTGVRMDSLRQGMERVSGHAERGLREAHQVMTLTRRVTGTLDAADQDLVRASGSVADSSF